MAYIRILVLLFLVSFKLLAQQDNDNSVRIIEEKTNKRHLLFAENKSDMPKSVFLKVEASGYRRRADRPVLKIIPPKSKVLMLTLIPLVDVKSEYTFIYVVNDELNELDVIRVKP